MLKFPHEKTKSSRIWGKPNVNSSKKVTLAKLIEEQTELVCRFEQRYEISSEKMCAALSDGFVREPGENIERMQAYHALQSGQAHLRIERIYRSR